ncbi:hypothetical protein AK830_g2648 [Neonectria ditissima]|uniref:Xylanolytic transcriptional activator regulatory domain-containing protein n=1 Tax=Neonectria ditissima TaxID=78410 RepID=A0A0N8H899_9HYPO|nr:hypothetical protein AK830_g2648 [Neonectria ditissima]
MDCVFLPPAIKKTRKRNEARIKELERKFQQIQASIGPVADLDIPFAARSDDPSPAATSGTVDTLLSATSSDGASPDPLSTGLVGHKQAEELYWAFCHSFAPLYPIVHVPESWTYEATRRVRPALFRAILTAASTSTDPSLSPALFVDTGKYLAAKVVVAGEKSLDLIQALLVLSTWQQPPEKFQGLKFSQHAQMAATMVMDLQSSNDEQYKIPEPDQTMMPSDNLLETCRSFPACYFLCSSIALSFRRPSVLRYGPWVERCIKTLEMAPFLHLNDSRLLAWVKLQRLAEESLAMVGFDEASPVDFSDARTRFILKHCGDSVTRWRQSIAKDIMCGPLEIHYHMILVSLSEPSLYNDHEISDFRPPYVIRALPLAKKPPSTGQMKGTGAVTQCAVSAQHLISSFLDLSVEVLRSVPVITYTRMAYAVIVLVKVYVSGQAQSGRDGAVLDHEWMPKQFLVRIIEKVNLAAGPQRLDIPVAFHCILSNLDRWCSNHLGRHAFSDQVIEPLVHLWKKASISETSSGPDDPRHLVVPSGSQYGPGETTVQGPPSTSCSSWEEFSLLGDVYLGSLDGGSLSGVMNLVPEFDFDGWDMGNSSS